MHECWGLLGHLLSAGDCWSYPKESSNFWVHQFWPTSVKHVHCTCWMGGSHFGFWWSLEFYMATSEIPGLRILIGSCPRHDHVRCCHVSGRAVLEVHEDMSASGMLRKSSDIEWCSSESSWMCLVHLPRAWSWTGHDLTQPDSTAALVPLSLVPTWPNQCSCWIERLQPACRTRGRGLYVAKQRTPKEGEFFSLCILSNCQTTSLFLLIDRVICIV